MSKTRKRRSNLSGVSALDLAIELQRRGSSAAALQARHDELIAEAEQIRAVITALGGMTAKPGAAGRRTGRGMGRPARAAAPAAGRPAPRTRPKNDTNLPDALVKILKGKTMSVGDAADAVQKAGYKTHSANFTTMVNIALLNKKRFKRVERGQYTAV